MNLYDIDKQLENVTSRLITHEDMAFLRSLPDFDKIEEVYYFLDYFVESGRYMIDISDTEKLFALGDIFPVTTNERYVYTNETSICVIIDLCDVYQIFFCSEDLRDKLEYIKLVFSCLAICFNSLGMKKRILDHVYSADYAPRGFIENHSLDF